MPVIRSADGHDVNVVAFEQFAVILMDFALSVVLLRKEPRVSQIHIGHGNRGDPPSFSQPHFHDKVIEYLDPASTDGGKLTREEAYFTNQIAGPYQAINVYYYRPPTEPAGAPAVP